MIIALKHFFFVFLILCAPVAWAADNVNVRFGKHDSYERLVFEWTGSAPDYTLEKKEGSFELILNSDAILNTEQLSGANSVFIKEFQLTRFFDPYPIPPQKQLGDRQLRISE